MADILHSKAWDTGETLVVLEGADVLAWLQGQVTQNVHAVMELGSAGACFCLPSGQIEAIAMLHAMASGRIGISTTTPEVVHNRLEQYVILEEVEAAGMSGPVLHWVDDPPPTATWSGRANRLGAWGWDFVDSAGCDSPRLKEAEANLLSLEYGIPLFGIDTDAKALPSDFGPGFERSHVAYDKGCYVGQEVIMRVHSRDRVPRLWCCLRSEDPLSAGAQLTTPAGQVVGKVTRGATSPEFGHLAAALLRSASAEPGTRLVANQEEASTDAEVVRFPRRPPV